MLARNTGVGKHEDGSLYFPLHTHQFVVSEFGGTTSSAIDHTDGWHTHAIDVDERVTLETQDHIHNLEVDL